MAQAKLQQPIATTTVTKDGKVLSEVPGVQEWQPDPDQFKRAMAAQEAISKGEDPLKAAKELKEKQEQEYKNFMSYKRYCIAVANLQRGHFDELDYQSLLDVVALFDKPVLGMEQWKKNLGE